MKRLQYVIELIKKKQANKIHKTLLHSIPQVAQDHPFLENDPLQSLYRRLVALNRCATMRLDSSHKHGNVS